MAFDKAQYEELKSSVERARQEFERSQGVVTEQLRILRSDFDVDSPKEARELIEKMKEEEERLEQQYQDAVVDFEKAMDDWRKQIGGDDAAS